MAARFAGFGVITAVGQVWHVADRVDAFRVMPIGRARIVEFRDAEAVFADACGTVWIRISQIVVNLGPIPGDFGDAAVEFDRVDRERLVVEADKTVRDG